VHVVVARPPASRDGAAIVVAWHGIDNALVEVAMPGGTMGGRSPTPEEATYPERVRQALIGP
jgi:hypothetical protein